MRIIGLAATAAALLFTTAPAAESHRILMFQPGQSSWEWMVVPARHDGARRMREGRDCLYCHEGEERVIGEAINTGTRLEPDPMSGMPHVIELDLTMSRSVDMLKIQLAWPAVTAPGRAGAADVQAQATVLYGSDALPPTAIAGCWISCHADLRAMPDAAGAERTKYLPNSRSRMTATGGGDALRGAADLAAELAAGRMLDYLQAELDDGKVVRVLDGYFLDARHEHEDSAVDARATLVDGRWTVEFRRPLAPPGPRLALETGKRYTFNFALHENYSDGRHHYVSFPLSVVIGAKDVRIGETQSP